VGSRYARRIAIVGLSALVALTLYTELTQRGTLSGLRTGERVPPFAAPLALSGPKGDVNVATRADEGQAGRRPACAVRGPGILNVCQLYEQGPVVLALFIDAGSCPSVLSDLQRLAPSFPEVRFAAVAIGGDRAAVARLVRSRKLALPVGFDRDGILAGLYRMIGCPQITFVSPGGEAQGAALPYRPSPQVLRAHVQALLDASRARGWKA
jgi:hypothetical protein